MRGTVREALVGLAVLMTFGAGAGACSDDLGDRKGVPFIDEQPGGIGGGGAGGGPGQDAAGDAAAVDLAPRSCSAQPVAYLFDHADPFTGQASTARAQLVAAGFRVEPLPLERSPGGLHGAIVFGSFASESADYLGWMARHAADLLSFVAAGNVVLQLTQAEPSESLPPFLPPDRRAMRSRTDVTRLFVSAPSHPLLAGVPSTPDGHLVWQGARVGWQTFGSQGGFEVLLAGNPAGQSPALIETSVGAGRLLLAALALDKPIGPAPAQDELAAVFFRNLAGHVSAVCAGRAPAVKVSPGSIYQGFSDDSTMLAVLPDTQIYTRNFPGVFTAQTSWIAANVGKRRIPYVLHLGDVTDLNTPTEWQAAVESMSQLDGVVPYALVTGNHDLGFYGNARTRDTLLNDYFPYAKAAQMPSFGGALTPGRMDNTYHLATIGGRKYVILALEWGPRDGVVAWADEVMSKHPDRFGILITHAYLYADDRRYDRRVSPPMDWNPHAYGTAGGVNDGEELWQKLVSKHAFVMVLNGHVLHDGAGYLASVTERGTTCHQMLSNYQFRNLGGEGYMRLIEFLSDQQTVRVYTYSPLYDAFLNEPGQNFTFKLDLPAVPPP